MLSLKIIPFLICSLHAVVLFHSGNAKYCDDYMSPIDYNYGLNVKCGAYKIYKTPGPPMTLGESPFYCKYQNSIFCVDNYGSKVRRYDIDKDRTYYANLGVKNAGCIIPFERVRNFYLIAYGTDICVMSWDGVSTKAVFRCFDKPDPTRVWNMYHLSDPACDAEGAFWFFNVPDLTRNNARNQSSLFCIAHGEQKTLASGLSFGQGTAWSYDRKSFFWIDLFKNVIYKSRCNLKTNWISPPRVLLNYTELNISGSPDSLTVDRDGYVWLACNGAGMIAKLNPYNGQVQCVIHLPAMRVSNMAFGKCPHQKGDELRCLYATTARTAENVTDVDGALYMIKDIGGSVGRLPYPAKLSTFFGGSY